MTAFRDSETGRAVNRVTRVSLREVVSGETSGIRVEGEARDLEHLRGRAGKVRAGALLTMADTVGGMCAGLAALPGWVVSTNLMLRTVPAAHQGPLRLDARVLRAGRSSVATEVVIRDAGDAQRVIADGVLTSAVLQPAGGPPHFDRPLVLSTPVGPDPEQPVLEYFGIHPVDESSVALEITDALRNPWGILHGGATAMLVDAAATHVVGGDASTSDVVLHFLRPGRVGPAIARASILGRRPDGDLVRIEVEDAGEADRVMAVAVATVRAP